MIEPINLTYDRWGVQHLWANFTLSNGIKVGVTEDADKEQGYDRSSNEINITADQAEQMAHWLLRAAKISRQENGK